MADTRPIWTAAGRALWATVVIPGGELTLEEARRITPADWSEKVRKLIGKALRPLHPARRNTVRAMGAVESGVVDIR